MEEDKRLCIICSSNPVEELVCPTCVGYVRSDIELIVAWSGRPLAREAEVRGINSAAAMLIGPAADPEAWSWRALSATFGRVPAGYLEDCRDEKHPLYVLATWEAEWRDALDQPTDLTTTIDRSSDYLLEHLSLMARRPVPDFAQFAEEIRECKTYLESVLQEGDRDELGAPCPKCGAGELVKRYGFSEGEDRWECRNKKCREWWTDLDYRSKVAAAYELHATALTASALHRLYRVPEGSVRAWASRELVRRRGKDVEGRQLYDVGDVIARRDSKVTKPVDEP